MTEYSEKLEELDILPSDRPMRLGEQKVAARLIAREINDGARGGVMNADPTRLTDQQLSGRRLAAWAIYRDLEKELHRRDRLEHYGLPHDCPLPEMHRYQTEDSPVGPVPVTVEARDAADAQQLLSIGVVIHSRPRVEVDHYRWKVAGIELVEGA